MSNFIYHDENLLFFLSVDVDMCSVLDQTNSPQADMTDQVEAYYQDFEPTNFALTPYCCAFIMEAANTNVIVVGSTRDWTYY